MNNLQEPKVGRYRQWLFVASTAIKARLISSFIALCVFLGLAIPLIEASTEPKHKDSTLFLPMVIFIALVTTVIVYIVCFYVVRRQITAIVEKRKEVLGRTPTPDEMKAMYIWYTYGILPTSNALQPILPNYVDYLESRLNGTYSDSYTRSKGLRYYIVGIAIFEIAFSILQIVRNPHDTFHTVLFSFVILLFLLTIFTRKQGKSNKFASKLNIKGLAKIAKMRTQLKQTHHVTH